LVDRGGGDDVPTVDEDGGDIGAAATLPVHVKHVDEGIDEPASAVEVVLEDGMTVVVGVVVVAEPSVVVTDWIALGAALPPHPLASEIAVNTSAPPIARRGSIARCSNGRADLATATSRSNRSKG
jgi:hypothetical protein